MPDKFAVSIIICTYNRAADLGQTLESLRTVVLPAEKQTELIIVDNGSTDNTAEVARAFAAPGLSVRYVREDRRGKGYAYNAGIAAAHGEVLLFSDDDMRLPPDWIVGMCGPIFAGEVDAVAGGVKIAKHLERPWMQKSHRLFIGGETDSQTNDNFELQGGNMAVSRRVLERVPGFDSELGPGALTGLWAGEETLFSWQILKAGYRLKLQKNVCAEHHFSPDRLRRESFLNRAVYIGRSHAYLAYHWQHKPCRWPRLRLIKAWLRLKIYQAVAGQRTGARSEGIDLAEFARVSGVHYFRQYLRESRRHRNYEQYGFIKRTQ